MSTPPNFWDSAAKEMEEYQLCAELSLQQKWDVPEKVAIHVAVSGRFGEDEGMNYPTTVREYTDACVEVIEAGACGVHLDYNWITNDEGQRLDLEFTGEEANRQVLTPLRERFGNGFSADCNILVGKTFEECLGPAKARLADTAPIASGHPDAFLIPAVEALEQYGVKPQIAIHSSGEIELAKRKLIDTGILQKPYCWAILYGLPFNSGRTLLSGTWVRNFQDAARHLFLMVDQLKGIDEDCVITVCAAGRATMYLTSLALMMGLNVRVGTEDTYWRFPNSDEKLTGNLEMCERAVQLARLHGREPATADDWRSWLGISPKPLDVGASA